MTRDVSHHVEKGIKAVAGHGLGTSQPPTTPPDVDINSLHTSTLFELVRLNSRQTRRFGDSQASTSYCRTEDGTLVLAASGGRGSWKSLTHTQRVSHGTITGQTVLCYCRLAILQRHLIASPILAVDSVF